MQSTNRSIKYLPPPLAHSMLLNKREKFEKQFYDGGCYINYGPKMVEDECLSNGTGFERYYFCCAQDAMVPLPLSYVPIIDGKYMGKEVI